MIHKSVKAVVGAFNISENVKIWQSFVCSSSSPPLALAVLLLVSVRLMVRMAQVTSGEAEQRTRHVRSPGDTGRHNTPITTRTFVQVTHLPSDIVSAVVVLHSAQQSSGCCLWKRNCNQITSCFHSFCNIVK